MTDSHQMYEAENGEFVLAATGDSMIARPLSSFREERFTGLIDILRGADAAFTNLEMQVHRYEPYPAANSGGLWTAADPDLLEDLKWAGIGMVSCANNHCFDYGENGLLTTLENIKKSGLVYSGIGRNLNEARSPSYFESPRGRVALLSCTSTFDPASPAGHQGRDLHGRPGTSALGSATRYAVDAQTLQELRRMSEGLGMERQKEHRRRMGFGGSPDTDEEFYVLGNSFVLGDEYAVHTSPDQRDMDDILRWVREARRQADWVFMSVHSHETGGTQEEPAEFLKTFARRCVDEGADAVLGHGPHFLRGVEVYKNRPIFYSLGNFIFQNEAIPRLPADQYERAGLDNTATPADFYDLRSQNDTRGFPADAMFWESVVAVIHLNRNGPGEVRLHPIELGFRKPRSNRGRPVLASEDAGRRILKTLQELSEPYGTQVKLVNGIGVIDLPPAG